MIDRTGPMLLPVARPASQRRTGLSGQGVGAAHVLFRTCAGHSSRAFGYYDRDVICLFESAELPDLARDGCEQLL